MNVREILKQWLIDNDYDGLQHESDCGCQVSDLVPCGGDCSDCTPGYKRIGRTNEECDWYIMPSKPHNPSLHAT